ncbi:MAG: DUF3726 domain-containing protein [Sedimentitalea sp.]
MTRSVSEISALLLKAGRGAGLSLGACEDLAMAAGAFEPSDLAQVAAMLQTPQGCAQIEALCLAFDLGGSGDLSILASVFERAKSPVPAGPRDVPEDVIDGLSELAARTFVPASDASRDGGAGSGLSDND